MALRHNLIALAAVITTGVQTYNALKSGEVPAISLMLLIVTVLCVAALFATDALMSLNKPAYPVLLTIHNIAPWAAVIAMVLVVYLVK